MQKMLCLEGRVSAYNYGISSASLGIILCISYYLNVSSLTAHLILTITWAAISYFVLKVLHNSYTFKIAIRAAFLGSLFTLGIYLKLVAPSNVQIFGCYMSVMSLFHYSEFLSISIIQPKQISTDSFMINHSPQYIIAAVTSWLEFFIESYFLPDLKEIKWISNVGLCICIAGELLRKTAIFTAGSNFNHLVQCEKANDHILVTHGVYGWFRHPSYVGWFYWSIGTQIILVNPICVPAYAIASWFFFKGRIFVEEIMLLNFFGQQYCDYQQNVGTGIPFINGYKI